MSLETLFGREHNVFQETSTHAHRVLLPWPVLNIVKYRKLLELDQRYYQHQVFSLNYSRDSDLETEQSSSMDDAADAAAHNSP